MVRSWRLKGKEAPSASLCKQDAASKDPGGLVHFIQTSPTLQNKREFNVTESAVESGIRGGGIGFDNKTPNLPGLRPCELKLGVHGGAANGRPEASKMAEGARPALSCTVKEWVICVLTPPPMMIAAFEASSLLKFPRVLPLYSTGAHKQIGVP